MQCVHVQPGAIFIINLSANLLCIYANSCKKTCARQLCYVMVYIIYILNGAYYITMYYGESGSLSHGESLVFYVVSAFESPGSH